MICSSFSARWKCCTGWQISDAGLFFLRYLGNQNLIYTGAVHIDDLEFEVQPAQFLTGLRNPFQNLQDQAAERIIVMLGIQIFHVEIFKEVIEVVLPVHQPGPVGPLDDLGLFPHIGNLPDQTFHDIFQGDDPPGCLRTRP